MWDDDLFQQSCILNAPTGIALTFADYIDPSISGSTDTEQVLSSHLLHKFIHEHRISGIQYISTGPDSVVDINEWVGGDD